MEKMIQCNSCQHFLVVRGHNGELDQYFCDSPDTKFEAPYTGWLRWDADGCEFHSHIVQTIHYRLTQQTVVASPVTCRTRPSVEQVLPSQPPAAAKISADHQVIKMTGLIALVLTALSLVIKDADRFVQEVQPAVSSIVAHWEAPRPTLPMQPIPRAVTSEDSKQNNQIAGLGQPGAAEK